MTSIAYVADVHLGNHGRFAGPSETGLNRRFRLTLAAFERAIDLAAERSCQAFVVLGDLFHVDRPSPQMEHAVQAALSRHPKMLKVVLVGNHDMRTTAPGDHALGPLGPVARVVERPEVIQVGGVELALVPFLPGHADEWIAGEVDRLPAGREATQRVLGIHLGVRGGDEPPWLSGAEDSVDAKLLERLMATQRIDCAVAGNWHWQWENGPRTIAQAGTLAPGGFGDTGWDHGGMVVWDTEGRNGAGDFEWVEVPGPRFVEAGTIAAWKRVLLPKIRKAVKRGCQVHARLVVSAAELPAANEAIATAKAEGLIIDGSAEPSAEERREAAERAAERSRAAETVDEAMAETVGGLQLPDGLSVDAVLDEARSCLREADKRVV